MYRVMIITSTLLNNLFIMNSMGELEYNQPCMKCIKGCYTPSATEDIHLSDVTLWLCFIKRLRDWSVPVDESSSTLINAAFSSPFCSFVAFVPRGFEKLKERNFLIRSLIGPDTVSFSKLVFWSARGPLSLNETFRMSMISPRWLIMQ